EDEIGRYYDRGLNSHINWAANNARAELEIFNLEVQRRYQNEIDDLEAEVDELNADITAFVEELREREEDIANRAQPLFNQIRRNPVKGMPSTFEWPDPAEGDEDADPLFDSSRSYVDQIDRYRRQQGKPEQADLQTVCCAHCNQPFKGRNLRA